ncbi:MAG: acetyltransferase [Bacteroides sp.]|nr:acetyltransferase [Bacteroides sp.]
MRDIAIYGAGGFGREVACMINKINNTAQPIWKLIGFFDDGKEPDAAVSHFGKVLGGLETLNNWSSPLCVALCFGNPNTVRNVRDRLTNPNLEFPNLIDPSFSIADPETFSIGLGNIIKGDCHVTTNVKIGNFNLLNGYVAIGHDVSIGDFNAIMPGARISGEVKIGNQNLLGADCFIKQLIKIGSHVTISPLSALLTKPKDGMTYIGNPAKIFKF